MDSLLHRKYDYNAIFHTSNLTPNVQLHLQKVYSTLGLTLLAATVGVYSDILFNIAGLLSMIAAMLLTMWLSSEPRNNNTKRFAILMGMAFFHGVSISKLIQFAVFIDPKLIGLALIGTVSIFAGLSICALLSTRRSFIFLGGIISSALFYMGIISLFNIFYRSSVIMELQLYIGLIIFCGYVLFDTQLILEKANSGDNDYIWHTLELFIDFISLFVRILTILLKTQENKKKTRRNDE